MNKEKRSEIFACFEQQNPAPTTELVYGSTFQLLVAVILSAQATDISVNKATKLLFKDAPTPKRMLQLGVAGLKPYIQSIGLYNTKAENIIKTCDILVQQHKGQVPDERAALEALPGVGRKTANVVAGDAFGIPAIAVDTHVERVSKRLRIVKQSASVIEVEKTLMQKIPKERWVDTHHRMIFFGRYHCLARAPKCETCPLLYLCEEGQKRLNVNEKK